MKTITYSTNPPRFQCVAISIRTIRSYAFFLQRIKPCELQRVTPRLARSRGGVKFNVVRDPSVFKEPSAQRNMNASCTFLMPTSLTLNLVDVNPERDVVLDVVPVRDDRVSGPTFSRIQRVTDESSLKHLCDKLMKTTFCHS